MQQKIQFSSEGQQIKGTLITPEKMKEKNPGVIFFHGMTSSEARYIPIAEKLAQKGIVGLTISIRGHGESEGNFDELTIANSVQDGLNAYDFLRKYNFIDADRIGICGASLGSAIAGMVVAKRNVKSLVLRAPAAYTKNIMKMTYGQIMTHEKNIFYKNAHEAPSVKALHDFRGSLLVITSEKDSIIPDAISEHYLQAAENAFKKEKIVILGATHQLTNDIWRKQFIDETVKWFAKTL